MVSNTNLRPPYSEVVTREDVDGTFEVGKTVVRLKVQFDIRSTPC